MNMWGNYVGAKFVENMIVKTKSGKAIDINEKDTSYGN